MAGAQGRAGARELAVSGLGANFVEGVNKEIENINGLMSNFVTGGIAGGSWGGAEGGLKSAKALSQRVYELERAAELDPDSVRSIASEIEANMPTPGEDGRYESLIVGGGYVPGALGQLTSFVPSNVRSRRMLATELTNVLQRLRRLSAQ